MDTPSDNERQALCAERIFDGERWHGNAAVLIQENRVAGICPRNEVPPDYVIRQVPAGAIVAPGFVDLQVNGGGGLLLNDDPTPKTMRAIALAHRRFGTTGLLPTLITDTHEKAVAAIGAAREIVGEEGILGLHLEGPFINPARAGIHAREHIQQAQPGDIDWLRPLGKIGHSLVTLAPECVPDGFIRSLVGAGIRVAAGHSEAPPEVISRAIGEGLSGVTHLFNAMPPFKGRDPGLVGTALAERGLMVGLIVDGIHVDPVSVRAAFAAKGADAIMLVTDAMPTVGATTREFQLVGRRIALDVGRLLAEDGALAGAHLDMASAVRNAVTLCEIPLEDALRAASRTPSRFLGLEAERGALGAGSRADFVAIDSDLRVLASWSGGNRGPAA